MNIKTQTSQSAIDAFLAKGKTIKKCPAREGAARSLRNLSKAAEKAAEAGQAPNVLSRRHGGLMDQSAAERAAARERALYSSDENRAEREMEQAAEDRYEALFG